MRPYYKVKGDRYAEYYGNEPYPRKEAAPSGVNFPFWSNLRMCFDHKIILFY